MKTRSLLVLLGLVVATSAPLPAQVATASRTRAHVETLASEKFGGRAAGSDGERLAADYIVSQLTRNRARARFRGRRDMFLPFEFTAGSRDGGSRISVGDGVRALSFSEDAIVEGEVVFAGYGLVVPESATFGYDSYAGLDVKDKIVLVLRYFPEDADAQTRAALAGYADLRYKANAARQRGAKAMLVVTGPRSPNAGELVPMTFDTAIAGSGIAAASSARHGRVDDVQEREGPAAVAEIQRDFDSGNPHVAGFPLNDSGRASRPGSFAKRRRRAMSWRISRPRRGSNGVQKPWVAVGAHYDHLGTGAGGNSLASREEAGRPARGRDDNASGTASVIALAEALAKQPQRKRNLLIALWSAERDRT
jgi:hypothetical protein